MKKNHLKKKEHDVRFNNEVKLFNGSLESLNEKKKKSNRNLSFIDYRNQFKNEIQKRISEFQKLRSKNINSEDSNESFFENDNDDILHKSFCDVIRKTSIKNNYENDDKKDQLLKTRNEISNTKNIKIDENKVINTLENESKHTLQNINIVKKPVLLLSERRGQKIKSLDFSNSIMYSSGLDQKICDQDTPINEFCHSKKNYHNVNCCDLINKTELNNVENSTSFDCSESLNFYVTTNNGNNICKENNSTNNFHFDHKNKVSSLHNSISKNLDFNKKNKFVSNSQLGCFSKNEFISDNFKSSEDTSTVSFCYEKKNDINDNGTQCSTPYGSFAKFSNYIDMNSDLLNFDGKVTLDSKGISFFSGSQFRISIKDLEFIAYLGHGSYGYVLKVLNKSLGCFMAMKEIRLELDSVKLTMILMELEVLNISSSPYIVDFYGAFFYEGAVYICMEYMNCGSLDKIYEINGGITDEACLAYIAECLCQGLKELKDKHNIIHRDIKPSNILLNTSGKIKLCDFGISGKLVASMAKTNVGCQSYMAPERIGISCSDYVSYSVQSDVWSLGLTMLEIAEGRYPYPIDSYDNVFSQLNAIVNDDPPRLNKDLFSIEAQSFINSCLAKDPNYRPSYSDLLESSWLLKHRNSNYKLDLNFTQKLKKSQDQKAYHSKKYDKKSFKFNC